MSSSVLTLSLSVILNTNILRIEGSDPQDSLNIRNFRFAYTWEIASGVKWLFYIILQMKNENIMF